MDTMEIEESFGNLNIIDIQYRSIKSIISNIDKSMYPHIKGGLLVTYFEVLSIFVDEKTSIYKFHIANNFLSTDILYDQNISVSDFCEFLIGYLILRLQNRNPIFGRVDDKYLYLEYNDGPNIIRIIDVQLNKSINYKFEPVIITGNTDTYKNIKRLMAAIYPYDFDESDPLYKYEHISVSRDSQYVCNKWNIPGPQYIDAALSMGYTYVDYIFMNPIWNDDQKKLVFSFVFRKKIYNLAINALMI